MHRTNHGPPGGTFAAGGVRNGHPGTLSAAPPPEPFSPNHRRYRTCCCHAKTFTLAFGVLELFIICFLLVAIVPDFNVKVCNISIGGNSSGDGGADGVDVAAQPQQDVQAVQAQDHDKVPVGEEAATTEAPTTTTTVIQTTPPELSAPAFPPVIRRRRQAVPEQQQPVADSATTTTITAATMQNMAAEKVTDESSTVPTVVADTVAPSAVEQSNSGSLTLLRTVTCSLTAVWLGWACLQMASVVLMCYGVRRQRWQLMVPHIVIRAFCALAVWLVIICLIGAFVRPVGSPHLIGHILLLLFLIGLFLWLALLIKSEVRCCEFVKRSAETGFSVSNTRPIGPPTMSQSDERERARAASAAMRAKSPAPGSAGARRYQTQAAMEAAAANGRATSAGQAQQPQQAKPQRYPNLSSNSSSDGGGGNEMTMTTLVAVPMTRPSTAGSGASPTAPDPNPMSELEATETAFGPAGGFRPMLASRRRPTGAPGVLPPLRHTFRA